MYFHAYTLCVIQLGAWPGYFASGTGHMIMLLAKKFTEKNVAMVTAESMNVLYGF